MENHYAALGLWRDASREDVRTTYRRLVSLHHPDVGGDPARFLEVQAAYDVLGDLTARRRYDAALRPVEPETEPEPRLDQLPAVRGERDRPSLVSLAALALGTLASGLLVGGLVMEHVSSLEWRTLAELRLSALVLGIAAAKVGRYELQKLMRLRELHTYGVVTVAGLPEPSSASRTAARCGWMLGRAAPIGFVLLTLATTLERIQPLLDTLRSIPRP